MSDTLCGCTTRGQSPGPSAAVRGYESSLYMSQVSSRVRPLALAWLEQAGERRYVESETRIGRGEQNNIRLADPSVSRDHALIRRVDGVYVISDLDTANGTFVNEQRVYAPRPLSAGDRIRLAESAFTFNFDLPKIRPDDDGAPRSVTTSISQFLAISGQIDVQSTLQGDLRVVTVLFLDLCGFTALSEKMSAEQVTLVVNQCFQHLTETAIRFDGFVDKYIGDAMMVLFGAPKAHDDDAERAMRAAIAMQDVLATYSERLRQRSGISLKMRIGINTGEVLAGAVGSGQFSAFTVMGDTVNLASRLESYARNGHILVNKSTYHLTKHLVRYAELPPTSIRGKNEMVTAYEVLGLTAGGVTREHAAYGPFAGRQRELKVLEMLLADSGRLRTAVLCGPAGIGKSRLVNELCTRHEQRAQAILVHCADFVERGLDAALKDAIGGASGTIETLAAEISALAQRLPVILVFDRTRPGRQRLARPPGAARDPAAGRGRAAGGRDAWYARRTLAGGSVVLVLRELANAEARDLVHGVLQSDCVEPETLDRLIKQSAGSPLVLEDMVTSSRARRRPATRGWRVAAARRSRYSAKRSDCGPWSRRNWIA